MIREMERMFETLKEDFQRKLATESMFNNIFGNKDDQLTTGIFTESLSDSFEEISMDDHILNDQESMEEISSITEETVEINKIQETCNQDLQNKEKIHSPVDDIKMDLTEKLNEIPDNKISVVVEDFSISNKPIDSPNDITEEIIYDNYEEVEIIEELESGNVTIKLDDNDEEKNKINQIETVEQIPTIVCPTNLEVEKEKEEEVREDEKVVPPPIPKIHPPILQRTSSSFNKHMEMAKKNIKDDMSWSANKEVIDSGVKETLTKNEINLQEAMFEILSTEAVYYHDLMVLTKHFFESDLFSMQSKSSDIVSEMEKHHIFSNIVYIVVASQCFLNDLEDRWNDQKPVMSEICDVLYKHAVSEKFQQYINYMRNQQYQQAALKRLLENERFKQQLQKLESSPVCNKLTLQSFLLLPFRRLAQIQSLLDRIIKIMKKDENLLLETREKFLQNANSALSEVKKLLNMSEFEKSVMEFKTMAIQLAKCIEFPSPLKIVTFSNQELILQGTFLVYQNHMKRLKKITKKKTFYLNLILFDDLLLVTKKKGTKYMVIDYCTRDQISASQTHPCLSATDLNNTSKLSLVQSDSETNTPSQTPTPPKSQQTLNISPPSQLSILVRNKAASFYNEDRAKRTSISQASSFKSHYSYNTASSPTSSSNGNKSEDTDQRSLIFSLKINPGQTDLFNDPIMLIAKTRDERDEWVCQLNRRVPPDHCKLQKSVSLHGKSTEEEMCRRKKFSMLRKMGEA